MLIEHGTLQGSIKSPGTMTGSVSGSARMTGVVNTGMSDIKEYTGNYSVTPSAEAQILNTQDLKMTDNVTIAPIPSNYGKIEYDGYGIRVS